MDIHTNDISGEGLDKESLELTPASLNDETRDLSMEDMVAGIKGEDGVSVVDATQIQTSTEPSGVNIIRFTLSDGKFFDFSVRNGSKYILTDEDKISIANAVTALFNAKFAEKADKTYVDTELGKKSDKTYVDTELGKKSNTGHTHTATEISNGDKNVSEEISDIKEDITTLQDGKVNKADLKVLPFGGFVDNVPVYGSGTGGTPAVLITNMEIENIKYHKTKKCFVVYNTRDGKYYYVWRKDDLLTGEVISASYDYNDEVSEGVYVAKSNAYLDISTMTKVEIETELAKKADKATTYTKEEVDDMIVVPMVEVTWSALKALRDTNKLIAGQEYRITDYQCTTTTADSQSANHQFDIIVKADSANVLNEDARAILHKDDTYFASCDLNAWELKYCLDNDTDRFEWADAENGRGVIYRMKDEWGNDLPYDFKSIQFKVGSSYVYTFGGDTDRSLDGNCHHNVMGERVVSKKQKLNFNTFGSSCYLNTFGTNCNSNTFGNDCHHNTFDNSCYSNTFGNYYQLNTFGNSCYLNTFGTNCNSNTFGTNCTYNTFGNYCKRNTFGNACNNNTFGYNCHHNTFGSHCYRNTFGNASGTKSYYQYITLESGVQYTYIDSTQTTSASQYLQNVHINSSVCGISTFNCKTITIPTVGNAFLTDFGTDSNGNLISWIAGEQANKSEVYTKDEVDAKLGDSVSELTFALIDAIFGSASGEVTAENGIVTLSDGEYFGGILSSGVEGKNRIIY